ncbi:MAG: peptide-N-glycosidase F-related protein [Candidatus Eisenbacteria bacterium]
MEGARLRYVTTGHGGWDTGDEFQPKVNELRVDGRVLARFVPWRSDCETYRRLNPASGNFWNGQSSSDFSRSGWCPGAAVSPMTLPLGDLAPGKHRIEVAIDMGKPVGESASGWNVSGVLLGRYAGSAR